jgi:peptidoglycan hydrolase-like protein with peptidoglycan-binding domain
VLKRGAVGEEVRLLQAMLNFHGASISVDSSFGPATEGALKAFQQSRFIAIDGSAGPDTWNELMKLTKNS